MKIIEKCKMLFVRYRQPVAYLFFGGCSMFANVATYYLCFRICHRSNVCSTAIAWLVAVLVAFVTNKLWVFDSKSFAKGVFFRELFSFFSCRIATGALDVGIMYLAVDCKGWNEILWKLLANSIVILLNYAASKVFIFRKNPHRHE